MTTSHLLAATLLVAVSAAEAQMPPGMAMPAAAPSAAAASSVLTDGVVQAVDAAAGTVTLKHGDITNLGMPGMTMAFGIIDKAMLGAVKAGDKVRFHVEMVKGAITVTKLQPVPARK